MDSYKAQSRYVFRGHEPKEYVAIFAEVDVSLKKKGKDFDAKIAHRRFVVDNSFGNKYAGEVFEGTATKANAFLKKIGCKDAGEDNTTIEQNTMKQALHYARKEDFEQRVDNFKSDLRKLLNKYNFKLTTACNGGGWGEAWGNATTYINDAFDNEATLLEADGFDEEETF